MSFHVDIESW